MGKPALSIPWLAAVPGTDLEVLTRTVSIARNRFIDSFGAEIEECNKKSTGGVRLVIVESWGRSLTSGVHPDGVGSFSMSNSELKYYRNNHPMALILPVIRKLLIEDARHAGLLVALTDEMGRLLWVEGDSETREKAEDMHFVEGVDWSEARVGTNAPGTAIAVDECVQIFGAEHFSRCAHGWSCSAAPVHDPRTGNIIGAIDITGGPRVVAPEVLSLVRTAAAVAEAELRLHYSQQNITSDCPAKFLVLKKGRPTFRKDGTACPISLRHAEILVLLAENPQGLTADALAVLLDERELGNVTIRAEMSRLRKVIGQEWLSSRPYRLVKPLDSDLSELRSAVENLDINLIRKLYPVSLLPVSRAPGILSVREDLDAEISAVIMATKNGKVIREWLQRPDQRDNFDAWKSYKNVMPKGSVEALQAAARCAVMEARFA
ncbi:MAG: GAF domain-containing protein [Mycobacteriaceae bacterium]